MPLQTKLLIAAGSILAAFVFGAWGAWAVQTVRMNHAIDALKLSHSEASRQATQSALDRYTQLEKQKDEAIAAHAELAAQNAISAASAKRTADSLRRDLATVPDRIAAASKSAVDDFAIVQGGLLGDCTAEYQRVASEAKTNAGHARLILDSWPKEKAP